MSSRNVTRAIFRGVVVLMAALPLIARGENLPFVGEINDRQVNIRSGPSTNYYVVARLQAGARVQVVAEESGWYGIVPPEGCYSVISKDYVDLGENNAGVVNGSAVRVRAGSDLDAHRYAVQTKLNKGDAVTVLGDADAGFLKIAPPPGAQVWIHSDYVVRVTGDGETPAPGVNEAKTASAGEPPAGETLDDGVPPPALGEAAQPEPVADPTGEEVAPTTDGANPEVTTPEDAAPEITTPEVIAPDVTTPEVTTPEGTAPEITTPEVTTDTTTPAGLPTKAEPEAVTPTATSTQPNSTAPTTTTTVTGSKSSSVIVRQPDPSVLPPPAAPRPAPQTTAWRGKLADADAAFKAEMAKPANDRNYDHLVPLYTPLAAQSEDQVVKLVAERRVAQLEANRTAAVVLREIEVIATDAERDRSEFADARAQLRKPLRTATVGYDAVGELRESLVFDTPNGPRRYRLVDPNLTVPRTSCYVEFPSDLAVDVNAYLGRMVAVKAREKYLETGDVNPIPVIVVGEITLATPDMVTQVSGDEGLMPPPDAAVSATTMPTPTTPSPTAPVDSQPVTTPPASTPGNYVTLPSSSSGAAPAPAAPPAPAAQSNPPTGSRTEPQMGTMVPVGSGS